MARFVGKNPSTCAVAEGGQKLAKAYFRDPYWTLR